jgi:putative ABC transport system substrate-binding protein
VKLRVFEAGTGKDLDGAFSVMARQRMEAVLVLPDGMFYFNRVRLAELALRAGLPSMFGASEMVEAGGLLQYAPNSIDNYRRAATFVDTILKGAKPADLPVQQPTKFDFFINLKTAKALGLTIPHALLLRADLVIPAD